MAEQEQKYCFKPGCGLPIYFEQGSRVPMDPETKRPHQHKKAEEKNQEEKSQAQLQQKESAKEIVQRSSVGLIKIVDGANAKDLEANYAKADAELRSAHVNVKGCQYAIEAGGLLRSICIYYDLPKEVSK